MEELIIEIYKKESKLIKFCKGVTISTHFCLFADFLNLFLVLIRLGESEQDGGGNGWEGVIIKANYGQFFLEFPEELQVVFGFTEIAENIACQLGLLLAGAHAVAQDGENPIHELETGQTGGAGYFWFVGNVSKNLKYCFPNKRLLVHEEPSEKLHSIYNYVLADLLLFLHQSLQQIDARLKVLNVVLFQVDFDLLHCLTAIPADVGQTAKDIDYVAIDLSIDLSFEDVSE